MPVFWRLDNVLSICHKPQQSWPACRNRPLKSFQNRWNYIDTEPKQRTRCTFKCGYLPCLCFWQAFLTSVSGQGQRDATAAQQKANLLTSCILGTKARERFMNALKKKEALKREAQERKKNLQQSALTEQIKRQNDRHTLKKTPLQSIKAQVEPEWGLVFDMNTLTLDWLCTKLA